MSSLQINLLGGFEISVGESDPLALPTRKARALLALLATAPEMKYTREGLAGMLWERSAEEQARATLRQTLSTIRKVFAEAGVGEVLQTGADQIRLESRACEVDVIQFDRVVDQESPGTLEEVCRLYKGDFLAGLNLREESFENWLTAERYRLQERARRVLERLLECLMDDAAYERAAGVASRLLAIDPLQEPVHRILMRIHLAEGRRASALHQFEACRGLLERELQIAPDEVTRALAREIRAGASATADDTVDSSTTEHRPAPVESEPGTDAPPLFAGEIRPVTVLFAALSPMDDAHFDDIERHHRITQRFIESSDRIVSHYGGHVEKHLGDSLFASFGVPSASGNDSERALRAALEIRDLACDEDMETRVQVGVAMGQAVVSGESGHTLTGDTMNVVQRLEASASGGEVLASESVCRAAERFVEHTAMTGESIRSRGREVSVHRVTAIRDHPAWLRSTRFIGRTGELQQLESVLKACADSGYGQVVFVRGEPGIGKTRLVEELEARAKDLEFSCHKVLVFDFGTRKGEDVPGALTRSLLGIRRKPGRGELARYADDAIRQEWIASNQRVFLNDLLDLPQPNELRTLYDAMTHTARKRGKQKLVADLVRGACAYGPVLMTVEDLHWAEPLVLEYLSTIARAVTESRSVMLLTSRAEGDPLDRGWRTAVRETPQFTLDLGPLRRAEAAMLARDMAGDAQEFADRCIERAEGNPLFLEQLLWMSEEQAVVEAVPETIQELALARSDKLPPDDKAALQAASVIGQRFSIETVRHLTGDSQYDCGALVDKDLVRPVEDEYLFAHALIRDSIYTSLLPSTRRALHCTAAEWFESRDPVLFAVHLEAAEDERAPRAFLNAAASESDAYRSLRALELIERGLKLATGSKDRFDLLYLKGGIRQVIGPMSEAVSAHQQAVEAAPDEHARCRAMTSLAIGLHHESDFDRTLALLDEAQAIAERNEQLTEQARIQVTRGNVAFRLGRTDECLSHHQRALQYAQRAGSREVEIHALGGLGDAYYAKGRMGTAHGYFKQCIDEARKLGLGRIESAHRIMNIEYWLLELEKSEQEVMESLDMAEQIGSSLSEMHCYLNQSRTALARNDLTRAEKCAKRATDIAQRLGTERFRARALHYHAQALLAMNQREKAKTILEEAIQLSRKTGPAYCGPGIIGAMVLAEQDAERRRRLIEEGESLLDQGAVAHNYLEFYQDVIEAGLERHDWKQAEYYAHLLEQFFSPEPLPLTDYVSARGDALSAFGRGQRDDGLKHQLERLRAQAREAGLMLGLPAIEDALQRWRKEATG